MDSVTTVTSVLGVLSWIQYLDGTESSTWSADGLGASTWGANDLDASAWVLMVLVPVPEVMMSIKPILGAKIV